MTLLIYIIYNRTFLFIYLFLNNNTYNACFEELTWVITNNYWKPSQHIRQHISVSKVRGWGTVVAEASNIILSVLLNSLEVIVIGWNQNDADTGINLNLQTLVCCRRPLKICPVRLSLTLRFESVVNQESKKIIV